MQSDTALAEYKRVQQKNAERQHLQGTWNENETNDESVTPSKPEGGRKRKAKKSLSSPQRELENDSIIVG